MHYRRIRVHGSLELPERPQPICSIEGCETEVKSRGWCLKHYKRWRATGTPHGIRTGQCAECGGLAKAGKRGAIPKVCDRCKSVRCRTCDGPVSTVWRSGPKSGYVRSGYYCSEECMPRCSAEGCSKPARKRGWCVGHYSKGAYRSSQLVAATPSVAITASAGPSRECKRCEQQYAIKAYDTTSIYCPPCRLPARRERQEAYDKANADRLREMAKAWRQKNPDRTRRYKQRRRSAGYVATADFTPEEIFERDRWKCRHCKHEIDPAARFPDPKSASIDHFIPLSIGGWHAKENVQTLCLRCNQSKGNRYVG